MNENKSLPLLMREVFNHYRDTGLPALRASANSRIILDATSRRLGSVRCEDWAASEWRHYTSQRLRDVKPGTLRRELVLIKSAWRHWGDGLPAWPRIKLPKIVEPEIRVLSDKEFERCLHHLGGVTRDAVLFARLTAFRRSEVVLSTWGDVSLERRTLTIPLSKHGQARIVP